MVIDRRAILCSLLASAFAPLVVKADTRQVYVSCRLDAEDTASVACFDASGQELFAVALPSRGHDAVERPGAAEVVVFARRPGNWLLAINTLSGQIRTSVTASKARRFCGHGVFSSNGRLLYATEIDEVTDAGLIGIYDATASYQRVGEFPSHGVGPHDLTLSADGKALVLANGGLRTDAVSARDVLVAGDQAPNLVRIDLAASRLINKLELPGELHKLSIRHLAARADGTVAFGCQHQGDVEEMPQLVGLLSPSGKLQLLESPESALARMKNYVGSVSFNADGTLLAATSPHGSQVMLWSMQDGRYVDSITKTDVCGIAPLGASFLASSGNSGVEALSRIGQAPALLGFIWDNHLLQLVPI